MAARKEDLISLGDKQMPWGDLPGNVRIPLKSVDLAFTAIKTMAGLRELVQIVGEDAFLKGVENLGDLSVRMDAVFSRSLTAEGRRKIGERVLSFAGCDELTSADCQSLGDNVAVRNMITSWVRRDFGVAISSLRS